MKITKVKALIKSAYDHVYTDEVAAADAIAKEFALSNSGMVISDFIYTTNCAPEHLIPRAWSTFLSQMESDEMYEGAEAELRAWRKDASKMVAAILKAGHPLTVGNARDLWEKKGLFAKK